jgi:hypothetical protein
MSPGPSRQAARSSDQEVRDQMTCWLAGGHGSGGGVCATFPRRERGRVTIKGTFIAIEGRVYQNQERKGGPRDGRRRRILAILDARQGFRPTGAAIGTIVPSKQRIAALSGRFCRLHQWSRRVSRIQDSSKPPFEALPRATYWLP